MTFASFEPSHVPLYMFWYFREEQSPCFHQFRSGIPVTSPELPLSSKLLPSIAISAPSLSSSPLLKTTARSIHHRLLLLSSPPSVIFLLHSSCLQPPRQASNPRSTTTILKLCSLLLYATIDELLLFSASPILIQVIVSSPLLFFKRGTARSLLLHPPRLCSNQPPPEACLHHLSPRLLSSTAPSLSPESSSVAGSKIPTKTKESACLVSANQEPPRGCSQTKPILKD